MKELIKILSEEFKVQPSLGEFVELLRTGRVTEAQKWESYKELSDKKWYLTAVYQDFLKQPLQLGYFVRCKDGEVLSEPLTHRYQITFDEWEDSYDEKEVEEYQKAKESVIYDKFVIKSNDIEENQIIFTNKYCWDGTHSMLHDTEKWLYRISDMSGQPITKQFWINFLNNEKK